MALTSATVTKQSVAKVDGRNDYTVTIHVVIQEDAVVIKEQDYSERYNSNITIDAVMTALQNQIKADWDTYVDEQAIFNAVAFDNVVSAIQTNLNTYINS